MPLGCGLPDWSWIPNPSALMELEVLLVDPDPEIPLKNDPFPFRIPHNSLSVTFELRIMGGVEAKAWR